MESIAKYPGLTAAEAELSREKFGRNELNLKESGGIASTIKALVAEPMLILLIAACAIYFASGSIQEGVMMLLGIVAVSGISLYQDARSRSALKSLKELSAPRAIVVRDGEESYISSTEIVVGDIIAVREGQRVPADAALLELSDLSIDESILTGESMSVTKSIGAIVFLGTSVVSGQGLARVTAVGSETSLGKLGRSLEDVEDEKTPLQLEISGFVRRMAILGIGAFVLVWLHYYNETGELFHGLLRGLTLAMSVLPEEIPVAFSVFMALGASRMIRFNVLTKQPQTVEALGSVTTICLDKTGTLTKNRMEVAGIFDCHEQAYYPLASADKETADVNSVSESNLRVLEYAMWSSEPAPFDPMETAIHAAYQAHAPQDLRKNFRMVHEYPLAGRPPVMTHIFGDDVGHLLGACKGAPEGVIAISDLSPEAAAKIEAEAHKMAGLGQRVLGVASMVSVPDTYPEDQKDFNWHFEGLIGLNDPPKENVPEVLQSFYDAGISVKMITGDFPETALNIAERCGLRNNGKFLTEVEISQLTPEELARQVQAIDIYARVSPETKLKIVEALKANGEIVAMTGDGVNDGPALKAAHVGVGMGKRGTEVAREAASLVLLDDDLSKMVAAIGNGRRIYNNLKKAIQYIVSIHVPIVGVVTVPLFLNWRYDVIFDPVHVIFLELVMGPTCSVVYENEPMGADTLKSPPRKKISGFLSLKELFVGIVQGLVILAGVLGVLQFGMHTGLSEETSRAMVFNSLVFANIFLTLVDRSRTRLITETIGYKNPMVANMIALTLLILAAINLVPFLRDIFRFAPLDLYQAMLCVTAGFVSVVWFEFYKLFRYGSKGSRVAASGAV